MIELGQTVGNYRVVAKLGEGGMGAVFLAEHPVIGRKAALKVIHPQHARNPDVVARFVNEATAINRVGHEHIVEVTDFGRTPGGDFYFAMEYLEGQVLSDLIAREAPFEPARAIAIAAQIADALAASHAHGVIHRDLKPENVFIITRGDDATFVKVLDFGLAKLVDGDGAATHETRKGIVMGTPYYMSPEQCEGRGELDQRADVYSLGVLLFEMLTGHLPFGGDAYGDVLLKHLTMQPPAARSLVPELPEELDAVLSRALAKRPAERFATMELFRSALLEPATNAPPPRRAAARDDLARRVRAAQPMSRAEIARRKTLAAAPPTTLGATVGHLIDDDLERVPRYTGPRNIALVIAAAMIAMALGAGFTYGRAVQQTTLPAAPALPRLVAITFASDPTGATVTDADGTTLGTTPLSIQVTRSDRPARYRFEKSGFEPKAMESIPNVPSSMFALMRRHAEEAEPRPADEPEVAAHHHRARSPSRFQDSLDGDGVLAPSFEK
jgi:eukaryotic-like serine/threonine-protein kinase